MPTLDKAAKKFAVGDFFKCARTDAIFRVTGYRHGLSGLSIIGTAYGSHNTGYLFWNNGWAKPCGLPPAYRRGFLRRTDRIEF